MDKFLIALTNYKDWKYLALYESGHIGWIDYELKDIPELKSDWRLLRIPNMKHYRISEYETGIIHDIDILQWADKDFTIKCGTCAHLITWVYVENSFREHWQG